MKKTLILGDIHFPFHNSKAIKEVLYAIKSEKPENIVQIGDLYDQYGFSRFTRKNIELPEKELAEARSLGLELWNNIRSLYKSTKCYQLLGNHDIRLIKRAQERLPEAQDLVKNTILELYRFKGVTTIEDDRHILKIGRVAFHHGYLGKLGDHLRYHGSSIVVGHSHTGGSVYQQLHGKILFELNAGYLADETAEPLRYRPTTTSKWTLGYGLVTHGSKADSGHFIPIGV